MRELASSNLRDEDDGAGSFEGQAVAYTGDGKGSRQRSYDVELQRLALVVITNFAGDRDVGAVLEAVGARRLLERIAWTEGSSEHLKQQAATALQKMDTVEGQ